MNYSITKDGKKLPKSKYTIDVENKVFSSKEHHLVLDFTGLGGWAFKTGSDCKFMTGRNCTFMTGSYCTFNTGSDCVFNTGWGCVFKTGWYCGFNTSSRCIFKTGGGCIFYTGSECTFKTDYGCTLLSCDDGKRYRHFLDNSNYIFTEEQLIEIKDKNAAILNIKHENILVRNLCKDILKG